MGAKKKKYAKGSGIAVEHRKGRVSAWLTKWRLPSGKRCGEFHATEELAKAHADSLNRAFTNHGSSSLEFTPKELSEWRAFRSLIGEGTSLDEVSSVWRQHAKFQDVQLGAMIKQFLVDYERTRPESTQGLAHLKPVMLWLETFFGSDKSVSALTLNDARNLFSNLPTGINATYSKIAYHKKVRQFFKYLENKEIIPKNRFALIEIPALTKADKEPKPILTIEETKSLFNSTASLAELKNRKEIIGRLALEAFTGMRHSTAGRIEGSSIDLDRKLISIKGGIDKKGSRYSINENAAEPNIWTWLKFSEPETWSMDYGQYVHAKRKAFERIGYITPKNPPKNVLRHSFATYHVSLYGSTDKTCNLLNHHGSPAILKAHYLQEGLSGPVAKAYFDILPPEVTGERD